MKPLALSVAEAGVKTQPGVSLSVAEAGVKTQPGVSQVSAWETCPGLIRRWAEGIGLKKI